MKRLWVWMGAGISGALLLAVALVVALLVLVDPNDYRAEISERVQAQTGVVLTMGKLGWSFYPLLGFQAGNVHVAMKEGAPQVAELTSLVVGVRVLPLLQKQIEVDGVEISGLKAHLQTDKNGRNNWALDAGSAGDAASSEGNTKPGAAAAETKSTGTSETAGEASALPPLQIGRIVLRDSSVRYEDQSADADYQVDLQSLELRNVQLDTPFPLSAKLRLRDGKGLDVQLALAAKLLAGSSLKQFSAQDLQITTDVSGVLGKTLHLALSGGLNADLDKDTASLQLAKVEVENANLSGDFRVTGLTKSLQWEGTLALASFDPKKLLANLGMKAPVTADSKALTRVGANFTLKGTDHNVVIEPLQVSLDESHLRGRVAVSDFSKQALEFKLHLDALDADRYLPPSDASNEAAPATAATAATAATDSTAAAGSASAGASQEELLPIETLRNLNIKGDFTLDKLTVSQIAMEQIAVVVRAGGGRIGLDNISAKLLEGQAKGSALLDVKGKRPQMEAHFSTTGLQLGNLIARWTNPPVLSGRASLQLDVKADGNDMDSLLRSALGQIQLGMAEGTLHGMNLEGVLVDALKEKFGQAQALIPNYEEKLPKVLKKDSVLHDLKIAMNLKDGHLITPPVNVKSDAGRINLSGDVDLIGKGLDYRFGLTLSSLEDHKYLKGTEWPVHCKGAFDSPAKDWCRPDMKAIGSIVERAGKQALTEKATEKIAEKLGIPGASEQEAKQAVREKVESKLEEKLSNKLNKLLGGSKKKAEKTEAVDDSAAP
ncbi:Uncharacterized protein involved in outer membrane biogenesis, AsmA family [gamma proteobacterium HdN1]|nr:Uncharacterized protein involved in outer membrane biogenesis, AsmA family [gamma proteobacterium HdN1]